MAQIAPRRLGKELKELRETGPPTGCKILAADDFKEWRFELSVLGTSVYEGETFCVRFRFPSSYPLESPEVVFIVSEGGYQSPMHGHCYSNGHICASILGSDWSPVMTVFSVLISLQSMLASSKKRERPPDNEKYIKHAPLSPKDTRFAYHDDTV